MTDRELMQQALDALITLGQDLNKNLDGIGEALRARLAQSEAMPPQPEPEHDLEDVRCGICGYMTYHREHMGCIRAASQPEPEPVGEVQWDFDPDGTPTGQYGALSQHIKISIGTPLYTAPPQREWQSLTDEERDELVDLYHGEKAIAHAIEAKLKEKNI